MKALVLLVAALASGIGFFVGTKTTPTDSATTIAYACGYRDGTLGMDREMKTPVLEWCTQVREIAAVTGFKR